MRGLSEKAEEQMALSIRAVRNPPVCPGLLAVTVMYAISIGGIEVIMNAGGTMSSGSWLEGKVVSSLFLSKKGKEKFLPTCVHCHVCLLVNAKWRNS